MWQNIFRILKGYAVWGKLRIAYRINYQKVVLVLPEENENLNYYALIHLEDWLKRKSAKEAIIITNQDCVLKLIEKMRFNFPFRICVRKKQEIEKMYTYYCFDKFFENIVFIYQNQPADNLLYKIIAETSINEEEAICLGFYCLRNVPNIKVRCQED